MTLSITTILRIWGTLIMAIIITINREFQYDFEYNYHTQNMGNVDDDKIITINRELQYDFEYEYGSFWKT